MKKHRLILLIGLCLLLFVSCSKDELFPDFIYEMTLRFPFGSFTWAGAAVKRMAEFAEKSKFEIIADPVEMKQAMKDITYEQCEHLARSMAERLKKDRE